MAKKEKRRQRNKTRCIRCGALKKSEKYISCMNEYCDTDTLIDLGYII